MRRFWGMLLLCVLLHTRLFFIWTAGGGQSAWKLLTALSAVSLPGLLAVGIAERKKPDLSPYRVFALTQAAAAAVTAVIGFLLPFADAGGLGSALIGVLLLTMYLPAFGLTELLCLVAWLVKRKGA